jgi:hypothetical protein
MEGSVRYVPTLGDEVTVLGRKGRFVVIAVRIKPESVDLKLTGSRELILRNTPWRTLRPAGNVGVTIH